MPNLGNVVGLLRSQTPPVKKYVLWAKVLNPAFPDLVEVNYWDDAVGAWTPVTDSTTQHWLRPVISNSLANPPALPTEGDRYLIPVGATGAWAGRTGQVTTYKNGAWVFQMPLDGFIVSVRTEVNKLYDFRGTYGDGGDWAENDFQVPIAPGDYIPSTEKGAPLGVATLDENTQVPAAQINGVTLPYSPENPNNYPAGINTIKKALDYIILQFGGNVSGASAATFYGDGITTEFTLAVPLTIIITGVFVGGQRYREGVHYTKNDALKKIAFLGEPVPEDVGIDVEYFSNLSVVDTNYRLLEIEFTPIVSLEVSTMVPLHNIAGPIAYTKGVADHAVGNTREDFLVANGINKPTFSADFILMWDNWVNTINTLNQIKFRYLPNGKIQYWLQWIQ